MKRYLPPMLLVALGLLPAPAAGWSDYGHRLITRAAVQAVAERLPPPFSQGLDAVADASVEPDVLRAMGLDTLTPALSPEHYLNSELLGGRDLPSDRYRYIELLRRLGLTPQGVGFLPYAVVEGVERLTGAFAVLRRRPGDKAAWSRALFYAGHLAHFAGDLSQPLHVTADHDGRRRPDGRVPFTGIHHLMDDLLERAYPPGFTLPKVVPRPVEAVWPAVEAEIRSSHAQVDTVYALEPDLRKKGRPSRELQAFARQRFRDGAALLAGLYLEAWESSAEVRLPGWYADRD
jgi:hypothetical protein